LNKYYSAYENIDLRCYPNYSFDIGDINGDGKKEFISLNQNGNRLRIMDLSGRLLLEEKLGNNGNWGTPLLCAMDIDSDGREEAIVPNGKSIAAFDVKGKKVREIFFESVKKDDFGIAVPLLGKARILSPDEPSLIAAVSGGTISAYDKNFKQIWKTDGFRNDFGHEIHFADIDGDGLDEIAFCTADHIGGRHDENNFGELVLLDHDGSVLLKKRVDAIYPDTHFDDIAMADFLGTGTCQILLEKGILLDLDGSIIWDISKQFDHGQWIAHTPNPAGKGELCFISEEWNTEHKSMLFTGGGKKIKDIKDFPWVKIDAKKYKGSGIRLLPTRCHAIKWSPESEAEFFLSQQVCINTSHECFSTINFRLNSIFIDLRGNFLGELPFDDSQIEGYYYNGEVHSKVADVDGDGMQEIVYPKQNGRVMVIKKQKDNI